MNNINKSNQLERDLYYLRIAKTISLRSKCLSRKIGAVLVKNDSIISGGFNGPAKGIKHCNERDVNFYNRLLNLPETVEGEGRLFSQCPRRVYGFKSSEGLMMCGAAHAERNALIQAARNGISTLDTTLYAFCSLPCTPCMIEIINAGVKKIVCLSGEDYDKYSRIIMSEAKIEIRQYEKELLDAYCK